ncbi:MAG: O-antigen ligase family protein [Deltaproteobacteria bacterium]|nr:O-antigen ligase family protein [Deltaproteobacteria bacterium]
MPLYYLLLFATPFHADPRLGETLFDPGWGLLVTPVRALGLLTVAAALLAQPPESNAPRLPNLIPVLFVPFAILPVLETVVFKLPVPSEEIGQLISGALLLIATRRFLRTRARMLTATRTLVIAFALSSLWTYKQHFIEHVSRAWGVEGESNYEALMLLLMVPMAFWMWRQERSAWWRRIGLGCAILLVGGLFLTESRIGIVGLGVVGVLFVLHSKRKFVGLAFLAIAALLILSYGPSSLLDRFRSIKVSGNVSNSDEGSAELHMAMIKAGIYMIEAHPVFGVGVGLFKDVAPLYNPEISKLIKGSYIGHNTFVQMGAECGLPELLLFMAMLACAFHSLRVGQHTSDEVIAWLCVAFWISLVGLCVVTLTQSAQLLPFWIPIFFAQSLLEIAKAQPELSVSKGSSQARVSGSAAFGSVAPVLSASPSPS